MEPELEPLEIHHWACGVSRATSPKQRIPGSNADVLTAPANDAVEYQELHFTAALANQTEYMGFPDDEIDKRWSDLYNCE